MSNLQKSRRTTITLEGDVSQGIRERLKENPELKEKKLINELLRQGLKVQSPAKRKFKIRPIKAELRKGISIDNIAELLDEIES